MLIWKSVVRSIWKKVSRKTVLSAVFFFPQERKKALERWLRGREEFRKLQLADCVVVSFGKSGRTWLRVMLSRVYQLKHGLSQRYLLGFDNLHYKNPAIQKIFFTHDNYIRDYTQHRNSKVDFYDKKVILLVRDPRDVVVSQFFQWKFRMKLNKKSLNDYPEVEEVSMFEFAMQPDAGLPKIIRFMNSWAQEIPHIKDFLVVRYEDMRSDPEKELKKVLDFIGTPASDGQIKEAVAFASYDNMKQLEQKKAFWLSGGRLTPKDRHNPNSYKVRRAKVGGYRDYFEEREIAAIEELIQVTLASSFGYGSNDITDTSAIVGL